MLNNQLTLPREVIFILHQLQIAGYEAYIVGGAVRDLLLQNWKKTNPYRFDFDFTTNAKPEEIMQIFPDSFYENQFGTVSLTIEDVWQMMKVSDQYRSAFLQIIKQSKISATSSNKIIDLLSAKKVHASLKNQVKKNIRQEENLVGLLPNFEITTFRSNEVYANGHRKPSSLEWGNSINEDLDRRDFTINALAIQIKPKKVAALVNESMSLDSLVIVVNKDDYDLIDQHNSINDLLSGVITTVGNPDVRFREDALRMLRAIRFAVQLKMEISDLTFNSIVSNANLISKISFERIRTELFKMLVSDHPKKAIELLDQTGLLKHILPELLKTKGIKQGGHHTTDVWTHSLDALDHCPSSDPVVRLATLLHDIAKPDTYNLKDGQVTAYNHEVIGARVAKQIARRLKLSKVDQQRIFTLVRYHMFHYQPQNSDASIRRFMRKVGLENIDDILDLREGDRLGSGAKKSSWRLEEMKKRMIEQLNQPLDVTDLAINGHDLINELGKNPGPEIGKILQKLFEKVLENPELNTKEKLLKIAKQL